MNFVKKVEPCYILALFFLKQENIFVYLLFSGRQFVSDFSLLSLKRETKLRKEGCAPEKCRREGQVSAFLTRVAVRRSRPKQFGAGIVNTHR